MTEKTETYAVGGQIAVNRQLENGTDLTETYVLSLSPAVVLEEPEKNPPIKVYVHDCDDPEDVDLNNDNTAFGMAGFEDIPDDVQAEFAEAMYQTMNQFHDLLFSTDWVENPNHSEWASAIGDLDR